MPTYQTPGVYIEEVPSGSMPLAAAGTAVAAFIGFTAKAPIDDLENDPDGIKPRMVTSWAQYKKLYGGFSKNALLPLSVNGFFMNGGGRCYIIRIPHVDYDRKALARPADLKALNSGEDGGKKKDDSADAAGTNGSGGLVDAGDSDVKRLIEFVNIADDGPVTITLGDPPPASENGDGAKDDPAAKDEAPEENAKARTAAGEVVKSKVVQAAVTAAGNAAAQRARAEAAKDGDSAAEQQERADAARAEATEAASRRAGDAAYSELVRAADAAQAEAGEGETVDEDELFGQDETVEGAARRARLAAADASKRFDVTITREGTETKFKDLSLGSGSNNVATVINADSDLVQVLTYVDDPTLAPEPARFDLAPPKKRSEVDTSAFRGDADDRRGVDGLVIADDVTMVMVPDLYTAARDTSDRTGKKVDADLWIGVQQAVKAHCELERNRLAILDPPPYLNPQQVREWRDAANLDSPFATLYYPWLVVDNPTGSDAEGNKRIAVPPCGHMAGIWARTDETRGVWKAPANEPVRGILDVQTPITHGEQEILNPVGINAIRGFGTQGIKVWGARTLAVTDPSWRYINVRRLFNMVETSVMDGTQWVVFEPNDETLWQRVTRTVRAFLLGLWRDGALFGASPDEAFFVKCDRENNPFESIDEGKLIVEVGIAPVKPAEFVIFRFSQKMLTSSA